MSRPLYRDVLELSTVSVVDGVSSTLCALGVIAAVECRNPRAPVLHDLIATGIAFHEPVQERIKNDSQMTGDSDYERLRKQHTRVHESTPGIPSMGHIRLYRHCRLACDILE